MADTSAHRGQGRDWWQRAWSEVSDADPWWRLTSIPLELQRACDSDWFAHGENVLDVGCGPGELAAWLAGAGYDVVGIDIAPAAIERARREHSAVTGLRFCEQIPPGGPFGAVLDRGCLHTIPAKARHDYVRNLVAVARPGASFLLYHTYRDGGPPAELVAGIRDLLEPSFQFIRAEEDASHKRLVLWLVRADP
jgi:SAM-dependent methyltransferase